MSGLFVLYSRAQKYWNWEKCIKTHSLLDSCLAIGIGDSRFR